MSKPKVWTLPKLLDRIWAAIPISNKTAVICDKDAAASVEALKISLSHLAKFGLSHAFKRVVTGWDEDYKPRTYELNKISAASAAALYERIKTMRAKGSETPSAAEKATGYREPLASQIQAWNDGYMKGLATYQTVNQPQPSIWKAAQEICPAPVSPAGAYERQFQDWADEVQRRGGL